MMTKLALVCFIAICALGVCASGEPESCPDSDMKYDIIQDEYVYRDGIFADSDGDRWVWWSSRKPDCSVVSACVCTDAGLVWLEPVDYGSWQAQGLAYYAVFWSKCNGELYHIYIPMAGKNSG